jgi:hypothetical protein
VLRSYRRIIYDARESSSPVSNLELIEKYEEKRPGARERNHTSAVNFSALKRLAPWDFFWVTRKLTQRWNALARHPRIPRVVR